MHNVLVYGGALDHRLIVGNHTFDEHQKSVAVAMGQSAAQSIERVQKEAWHTFVWTSRLAVSC